MDLEELHHQLENSHVLKDNLKLELQLNQSSTKALQLNLSSTNERLQHLHQEYTQLRLNNQEALN
jgi:uncharacterized protein YsxB (DUF464 family)